MDKELKGRLKALISTELALVSAVQELQKIKGAGFEQEAVRNTLEDLRSESKSEAEEYRILDLLDFVTGFCSPPLRIWD